MRQEAVGLLRAQERAQLVARRGGVEVAQRDRVPARVPQELGRELATRRDSGSGTRRRRACARPPGFARTRCARRARRDVRTRSRSVGAGDRSESALTWKCVQVSRNDTVLECPLCGRTLLLGERVARYRAGPRHDARLRALRGRRRRPRLAARGSAGAAARRGAARARLGSSLASARASPPRASRPTSRPRSTTSRAPTRAVSARPRARASSAFNRSPYRRAVAGISKSLGDPLVSVVPLAGTRPDVVVTVAWDISWYQYRVDVSAGGTVRLESRGRRSRRPVAPLARVERPRDERRSRVPCLTTNGSRRSTCA